MARKEKAKGKIEETKGMAKERTGDVTGNASLQARGKAEKTKGNVRQAKEKAKDAFKK
ncbi:CsbD family protein [Nonomuraea turcica]|uniref:CsbD family protein n=1 Tax=Nonomuraea sp. G32 TaxID=3067274 RepID=UPI00273C92B6|nr:CsbD family protein [Nonomuraea sp. G32]MDP4506871.1 CsbD family protein [Nonomuraea sp. G32]